MPEARAPAPVVTMQCETGETRSPSLALGSHYVSPMTELAELEHHLVQLCGERGRALLGYSGGIDSAFLAVVANAVLGPGRFLAVIARSPSYPEWQWQIARDVATQFAIPLSEITTHELDDADYRANPTNRCYFCKRELWQDLWAFARQHGFTLIMDGTNVDDLTDHRPGHLAAAEERVHSPLAALGWTKSRIREQARGLGIPIWDQPAAPCLASRIRYGVAVTPGRLRQVERGESYLRALGITGDLRVRHLGDSHAGGAAARIEVTPSEIPLVRDRWSEVEPFFQDLGFASVELDPAGYRRGSLLALATSGA